MPALTPRPPDSQVQTGEQPIYFGCQGPAGQGYGPVLHALDLRGPVHPPDRPACPISWATSRWSNPEYDAVVEKISPLQVDDPKTLEYFTQAMDVWFKEMPMIYVSQLIIRYPMNTTYWTGWPSKEKPYGFPHSWQQELMKTLLPPAANRSSLGFRFAPRGRSWGPQLLQRFSSARHVGQCPWVHGA